MDLDSLIKKAIAKEVSEAVGQVYAQYNDLVDQVIESTVEFADLGFDDKDIVDTGRLLNSKTVDVRGNIESGFVAEWEWDPVDPETGDHYAKGVYYGFFAYGRKYIPGRPWAARAINKLNPVMRLEEFLKLF